MEIRKGIAFNTDRVIVTKLPTAAESENSHDTDVQSLQVLPAEAQMRSLMLCATFRSRLRTASLLPSAVRQVPGNRRC